MKMRSRLTALVLAVLMLISTAAPALAADALPLSVYQSMVDSAADQATSQPVIDEGGQVYDLGDTAQPVASGYDTTVEVTLAAGEGEQNVALPVNGKVLLTADIAAGQWQVQVGDQWVNMHGETGSTIEVTFAKVQSLFVMNNAAKLRFISADGSAVSNVANVGLDYSVQTLEEDVAMPMMYKARALNANAGIALAEEVAAEETSDMHTVVIRYVVGSGDQAYEVASSYSASIGDGTDLITSVIQLPEVVGYEPGYVTPDDEYVDFVAPSDGSNGTIQLFLENVTEDVVYVVRYVPAEVNFKVNHMWLGFDGKISNAVLHETETKTGDTGDPVGVGLKKEYDGFKDLWYDDTTKIAADGTTIVNVYYERKWYLMLFDLDGGFGVEPIYAQYGADIEVGTPTKPGYTFVGWSAVDDETADANLPPETMPCLDDTDNKVTYYAIWKPVDLAKVSVVIWGENADDEGYSYIKSSEFYAMPGTKVTYETGNTQCGYSVHTHTDACFTCGQTAHKHSADCCVIEAHTHSEDCCTLLGHKHSPNCYENVGAEYTATSSFPTNNLRNGRIHSTGDYWNRNYYIYINGKWYVYNGTPNSWMVQASCGMNEGSHDDHTCVYCDKEEHVHNGTNCEYCDLTEHEHTQECMTCTQKEHVHTDDCYITNPSMDSDLWQYVRSDEVTVNADGSSVMNVYFDRVEFELKFYDGNLVYTIKEKWGSNISEHWPIEGTNGRTYDDGERWDPSGSSEFTEVLVYLDIMPAESFNLNVSEVNYDTFVMHYMVEVLPGETGSTYTSGGTTKTFKQSFEVSANYNYVTKAEDFFDLEGYTQWASNPSFGNGSSIDIDGGGDVYFYYTRNRYKLVLNNGEENEFIFTSNTSDVDYAVRDGEGVLYEASLADYEKYEPHLPSFYEADSREFAGWYLNPECTGEQVILSAETMPAENVILYAKWVPVVHTVKFDVDLTNIGLGKIRIVDEIKHYSTIDPALIPTKEEIEAAAKANGYKNYSFVAWFYQQQKVDDNGNLVFDEAGNPVMEEKAFDPATMPITKDLNIYAKWSATEAIPFTIYYRTKDKDGNVIDVAEPTQSKALDGTAITAEAKVGNDLYVGFREGYFPTPPSHSIEITVKVNTEYTFWYTAVDAVPYRVVHVKVDAFPDGNDTPVTVLEVLDDTTYPENKKTVVTENYKIYPGLMPDTYQKRLIVAYPGTTEDTDNDNRTDAPAGENIIFFYYVEDEENTIWNIMHYVEPVGGAADLSGWDQYGNTLTQPGKIGTEQTANTQKIKGFTFVEAYVDVRTIVDGEVTTTTTKLTDPEALKQVLTNGGIDFRLYYTRNEYPVKVQYLEKDTNEVLADPVLHTVQGVDENGNPITIKTFDYQSDVEVSTDKEIPGYELVSASTQELTIVVEEGASTSDLTTIEDNVITFYYAEKDATFNYVVVGTDGCGTVDLNDEVGIVAPAISESETVTMISGTPVGATAVSTNTEYFVFEGWYSDAACTEANKLSTNASYVPTKAEGQELWPETSTFYAKFVEQPVTITYKVVGPDGCGTVDVNDGDVTAAGIQVSETIANRVSGTALGATAAPSSNVYKFVGWYTDKDCTKPVVAADGTVTNNVTFVPAKEAANAEAVPPVPAAYDAATFYAKFEYNLTSLTITKTGVETSKDPGVSFVFNVEGNEDDTDLDVAINENGSVTIYGLTVGNTYTVTEELGNWRYSATDSSKGITLVADADDNVVTFVNSRTSDKWLDGDCYDENVFTAVSQ